ncbi:GNAT family N-acetyltransferase [Hamadaea sp. NPDC050747]|uniref:GNAT family N-acetyltransferase n=1 Tax=Hamadaea sp. NPDC050747 TaxID=3155789 RepID=UPI0033D8D402
MTASPSALQTTSHSVGEFHDHLSTLLDVYAEIYADKLADPFFGVPRYQERLEAYAARSGFGLAIGNLDGEVIGYALGFTLPQGSGWWRGLLEDVDPTLVAEDGSRTFAITEIMVREPWRRRGYAKALHDAILEGRSERRATLLVLPDNLPAQAAYRSWGWHRVGGIKPFDDAPVYDAMILTLRPEDQG